MGGDLEQKVITKTSKLCVAQSAKTSGTQRIGERGKNGKDKKMRVLRA